MTTPADRFKNWIDSLADTWKERLRGWMASWVSWGLELFADILGKGLGAQMPELLDKLELASAGSPEIQELVKRARKGGGQWQAILLGGLGGAAVGGAASSALFPPLEKIKQFMSAAIPFQLSPVGTLIALHYRKLISDEIYTDQLHKYGFDDAGIKMLEDSFLFYPSPADLVHWQAREVFEPLMISKYGLDDELGEIQREPFYKAGMNDEQITNFWRAHWEHASWMQIVEMLHRGLLKEKDVRDWFRLVEIPPFWRQNLIDTAYTWPTRVDVRRWWDMRTIDEAELRRLYSGMGYRGINLDNYILWTKVYVAFPDLMARWSNGWITEDDVREELTGLGMPAARVEEMIQSKIKAVDAGKVEEGKDLNKTEIYKGVKKGTISRDQAIDLLMDLNYTLTQAEYLLDINVAALEGSPETYEEFKELTTRYKIAIGKAEKAMPEELKHAAAEVVRLTKEVKSLQLAAEEEKRGLVSEEIIPEETTKRLKGLQVKLHRAESKLAAARSEYDRLVAEWRHGGV